MNVFPKSCLAVVLGATLFCASWSRCVAAAEPQIALPLGIDELINPKPLTTTLPELHLKLLAQPKYALGEPIEVTMRYTWNGEGKLAVKVVDFDRSGRVADYNFRAWANKEAVRDPATFLMGPGLGGPLSGAELSQMQPFEQKVVANQWLAFDKPGIYFLEAQSNIVHTGDDPSSGSSLTVESEPIQIEITAPDEAKRRSRLTLAKDVIAIEDREIDQTNRQTRLQVVQSLRFMLDERALPLLVRALNDGWVNVQNEAELGLRAFKDMTPVKAELLHFINDKNTIISPRARQTVLQLLVDADNQSSVKTTSETVSNYNRMLDEKLAFNLKTLPLAQSLEMTVEAMYPYDSSGRDAANWNRVLDGATLMSQPSQEKASKVLLYHLTANPQYGARFSLETLRKMQSALLKTARDEKIEGMLRSNAIVALARISDQSQRELLVSEFMKPQPSLWKINEWGHVWDEAQKALNGYKTKEIAVQLLGFLNNPDFFKQDYYAKRSVILRLSDFGDALSSTQLTAATKRVIEYSKDDQESEAMLHALSRKTPHDTVRLIEELPTGNPKDHDTLRTDFIIYVVSRTDTRRARKFTKRLFRSSDERERVAIIAGFAKSALSPIDRSPFPERGLPIRPDLAARYFPQILQAFQTDTSREVRTLAFYALSHISSIPDSSSLDPKNADEKRYIPQWQAWYKQYKAHPDYKSK